MEKVREGVTSNPIHWAIVVFEDALQFPQRVCRVYVLKRVLLHANTIVACVMNQTACFLYKTEPRPHGGLKLSTYITIPMSYQAREKYKPRYPFLCKIIISNRQPPDKRPLRNYYLFWSSATIQQEPRGQEESCVSPLVGVSSGVYVNCLQDMVVADGQRCRKTMGRER